MLPSWKEMMRALVMDFPDDPKARDVQDQYLFGPAFLVSPVRKRTFEVVFVLPHAPGALRPGRAGSDAQPDVPRRTPQQAVRYTGRAVRVEGGRP
jgi:hypothetical protein